MANESERCCRGQRYSPLRLDPDVVASTRVSVASPLEYAQIEAVTFSEK
jgi:hypothetical protein